MKKKCSQWFSNTIRDTMKEMGKQKSRPQVIAISAKRTIKDHPECKRYLDRPQEKIVLDDKHWVFWSSKSFRLYRGRPCAIRIFFSKRAEPTSQWKKTLPSLLRGRLGLSSLKKFPDAHAISDDYLEIPLSDPNLILALLHHRVANFLD